MKRVTRPVVALSLSALTLGLSAAHAAGDAGPDILGVRTGMSPEQVYEALKSIDVTHRVTVAQTAIPALLGQKTAVFAMAPESRNSGGEENLSVWISLPPNAQQVWSVQRQFNNSIHTTMEQIVDSLRQKYGAETVSSMYASMGVADGNTRSVIRFPVRIVTRVVAGLFGVVPGVTGAAVGTLNAARSGRSRRTALRPIQGSCA